jgi:hypothetical protein
MPQKATLESPEQLFRKSGKNDEKKEDTFDSPKVFIQEVNENALALFCEYQYSDPMMRLNEWFQKKGISSIGDCFTTDSNTDSKGPKFWRCRFKCPLTKEEYPHSSLPLPLLHGEQTKQRMRQCVQVSLGESSWQAYHE